MTVKELIDALSSFRDDEIVFTSDLIPVSLVESGGVPYIVDIKQAKEWVVN